MLQRYQRNYEKNTAIDAVIKRLLTSLKKAKYATSLEHLRGIEGEAAYYYFSVFQYLVKPELHQDFKFNGRNRRPALDPVNALMSFMYSIIGQDISAALSGVGLDPQIGFLHADRSGRDSLAQDLLEEFRAWLCDRLVLSMINRKQIQAKDFITEASGALRLTDDARKTCFNVLQMRKQEIIMHPFLKENVEIGLLPHIQALLLARHLRGDLAFYPPFYIR